MFCRILVWLLMVPFFFLQGAEPPDAEADTPPGLNPWTNLGTHAISLFSGSSLLWQGSALAASLAITGTGLDRSAHNFFVAQSGLDSISAPGVYAGYLLPAGLGLGLWGGGLLGDNREIRAAGSAVLQATLLAAGYNILLKGLTGRPAPDPRIYGTDRESQRFRFGVFRGGIHWGWPSGHMMTNTAALTSLMAFYRDSGPIKIAGYAYLTYLLASVLSHEKASMHWLSDTVTGTMLGALIGLTIGRRFRQALGKKGDEAPKVSRLDWTLGFSSVNLCWSF